MPSDPGSMFAYEQHHRPRSGGIFRVTPHAHTEPAPVDLGLGTGMDYRTIAFRYGGRARDDESQGTADKLRVGGLGGLEEALMFG